MDAVGARRPVLMGSFEGARSLALLAATRPERVGGLIAFSPSGRGAATTSPEFADSAAQSIAEMTDWPGPLPELYAPRWAPDSRHSVSSATSGRSPARVVKLGAHRLLLLDRTQQRGLERPDGHSALSGGHAARMRPLIDGADGGARASTWQPRPALLLRLAERRFQVAPDRARSASRLVPTAASPGGSSNPGDHSHSAAGSPKQ
jgi:pimeloyl-ACP methyl ester carboxylesterase